MEYAEHGSYSINIHDDIVLIRYIGPTNEQTYISFQVIMKKIGRKFNESRWAEIIDYTRWELTTPNEYEVAKSIESNPEKLKYRCKDQVVLVNNILTKSIIRSRSEDPIFIKPDFTDNDKEAFDILQRKGYKGKLEIITENIC